MKYTFIILLFFHIVAFAQSKPTVNGTYTAQVKRGVHKFLAIRLINDSTFIFGFASERKNLNFDKTTDFGIAHLVKNEWVGLIDLSYMDREYGDFTEKDKNEGRGFFIKISFGVKRDSVYISTIYRNIRGFVDANYGLADTIPLEYKINSNFKRLGYAYLLYKANETIPLYYLPEKIYPKGIFLKKGETIALEGEYIGYVFVVKYSVQNKVIKSGWVHRKYISFLKTMPYTPPQ